MRKGADWARERFADARVARLATVSGDGSPHLVPIVFAVHGDRLISAVDHKPKQTVALRRLDNIAANPFVSVLVDEYDENWTELWWARADGWAHIDDDYDLDDLIARYSQYQDQAPSGPTIVVEVDHWSGWSAS
jgi:PPOX class probable F420-dependent enzyme